MIFIVLLALLRSSAILNRLRFYLKNKSKIPLCVNLGLPIYYQYVTNLIIPNFNRFATEFNKSFTKNIRYD